MTYDQDLFRGVRKTRGVKDGDDLKRRWSR